jgi:chemotaxis protein MotB
MRTLLHIALAALMTATLSGCLVSESTYLKKVSELDALTQDQTELQNRHKALRTENTSLRAALVKLDSDHSSLKEIKAKLDETVTKLISDNKDLENDLAASKGESQQRISELRQKIGIIERENGRLRQEIVELQQVKKESQKASKAYAQLLETMQSEIAQGQVTISELKGKLTVTMVDAILFDSGRAEVKENGVTVLQKIVDILNTVKDKTFRIEGHTDNTEIRGALINKYATNWELSAARAINVTRFLQEQGLEPDLLMAVAYGEYKPVAPNDSAEGKAKNRRIEIILMPKE